MKLLIHDLSGVLVIAGLVMIALSRTWGVDLAAAYGVSPLVVIGVGALVFVVVR